MSRNDFLLPDELGWEANDEISKLIEDIMGDFMDYIAQDKRDKNQIMGMWTVTKAQLMDDIYAIIKKYQSKELADKPETVIH